MAALCKRLRLRRAAHGFGIRRCRALRHIHQGLQELHAVWRCYEKYLVQRSTGMSYVYNIVQHAMPASRYSGLTSGKSLQIHCAGQRSPKRLDRHC
jgi:hypothetical protein